RRSGGLTAQRNRAAGRELLQLWPRARERSEQLFDGHACRVTREEPGEDLRLPRRPGRWLGSRDRTGDLDLRRVDARPCLGSAERDQATLLERAQLRRAQRATFPHGAQQLARPRAGLLASGEQVPLPRALEERLAFGGERRPQLLAQVDARRQRPADGESQGRQVM